MRAPRLLHEPGTSGAYFLSGRIVNGRPVIGPAEKARLMRRAANLAHFAGIELLSMSVTRSRYHILAFVPAAKPIREEDLIAGCREILPDSRMKELEKQLAGCRNKAERQRALEPMRARRLSIPSMAAGLQQDFTFWYNSRVGRNGTMWDSRYHSVLLEHETNPSAAAKSGIGPLPRLFAAYADLAAVRDGLAKSPEEGEWTSYARAKAGDTDDLRGLRVLWGREVGSDGKLLAAHALLLAGGDVKSPAKGDTKAAPNGLAALLHDPEPGWVRARAVGSHEFIDHHLERERLRGEDDDTP